MPPRWEDMSRLRTAAPWHGAPHEAALHTAACSNQCVTSHAGRCCTHCKHRTSQRSPWGSAASAVPRANETTTTVRAPFLAPDSG